MNVLPTIRRGTVIALTIAVVTVAGPGVARGAEGPGDPGSKKTAATVIDFFDTLPRIGNRVWTGQNVIILKGVTIGDDVIIGAGSVVTSDLPAATLCAGQPAQVVKELNS